MEERLNKKLEELTKKYADLLNICSDLANKIDKLKQEDGDKPHKCPICHGLGAVNIMEENLQCRMPQCNGCKGTGIVWRYKQ